MRFILFILFVAMPFIELALLISLGQQIGFWPTIGIVVVTAAVGAYVLHVQGLATFQRIAQSMSTGEPPIKPVVDGFFLAVAGAFLLTPGVVTDSIGLLLLVPPVRHAIARWAFSRLLNNATVTVRTYRAEKSGPATNQTGSGHDSPHGPAPGSSGPGKVIDGEFEEIKKK